MEIIRPVTSRANPEDGRKTIKLLVWDLDNTIWQGTLLEGDEINPREIALTTLDALDQRGILHSIASKNDERFAMAKLKEIGIEEYFLYPQVNWNSKAANIRKIANSINIGLDAIAFIDDDPYEREEVKQALPEVLTLDDLELDGLLERPEFNPLFITDESAQRRKMYRADIERKYEENRFVGPSEEFLAGLHMVCAILPAQEEDLKRAEELTIRTHQLNTTGYTYSFDELNAFRRSPEHSLLIVSLNDRFGAYGKIGLALIERGDQIWTLKLLLMSCRVMSRGIGSVLLNHVLSLARSKGVRLRAEFLVNERNRMMLIIYKLGGFREIERSGNFILFEHDMQRIQSLPDYIKVQAFINI